MIVYTIDSLPEVTPFLTTHIIASNNEFAIVDPGPKRAIKFLLDGLRGKGIDFDSVKYVLLTHIHIDHAGGTGELLKYLPNASVVMHERGVKHMVDPSLLWEKTREVLGDLADFYGEIVSVPEERIIIGREGLKLRLGEAEIIVYETPGHASHSITFWVPKIKAIFPGDSAGVFIENWSVHFPTTPMPFNAAKALDSIEKMIRLEPQVVYFPHFGRTKNAMEYLRSYKKQLEMWLKIVEENIDKEPQEIAEIIMDSDSVVRQHKEKIIDHTIWRDSILRSIRGIKAYYEWIKQRA